MSKKHFRRIRIMPLSRLDLLITVVASITATGLILGNGGPTAASATDCRLEGEVSISTKLVCPREPVEMIYSLRFQCDAEAPFAGRSVRLVETLPPGVIALDDEWATGADGEASWTLELSDGCSLPIVSRRTVVALHGGSFEIGGAEVVLIDGSNEATVQRLAPAELTVVPDCGRIPRLPIFLPVLHRPKCSPSLQPADIALLIDRSASLGPEGLRAAAKGAGIFLDNLNLRRDRVAVVAFDRTAEIIAPLGADRATMDEALGRLSPRHGTRLESALDTAAIALGGPGASKAPPRRRIAILVSDGVPIGPRGREEALAAAARARAAGVSIITLGVGPASDYGLLAELGDPGLVAPIARDAAALPAAYRRVAEAAACGG